MAVSSDARAAQDSKFEAVSETANRESNQKLSIQGWDKNNQGLFARKNQDEADIDNLLAQAPAKNTDKVEDKEASEEEISLETVQNLENLSPDRQMQIIEQQLKVADEVFIAQLQRASSPEAKADIYRKIAENHFAIGQQNLLLNKPPRHQEHMVTAKSNFNSALKELDGRDTENNKLERAKILGNLAHTERNMAKKIGDEEAKNAELHYEQAINLWNDHKPQDKFAEDEKDQALIVLYTRQAQLYNLIRQPEKAIKAQEQSTKLLQKHPEWRLQRGGGN